MRLFTASLIGAACMGGAAMACPNPMMSTGATAVVNASGMPMSYPVLAGGEQTLEACGLGTLGFGQFRSAPDFTFDVFDMVGRELTLAVSSDCDPAMLVHTSDGQWLFDDDTDGLNPAITITNPAQMTGSVNVWVGTFFGSGCMATLDLVNQPGGLAQAPAPMPAPMPAPAPAPMPMPANCPNPDVGGPPLSFMAQQLMTPQGFVLTATGGDFVGNCPGVQGGGTASVAPQTTLFVQGMVGMDLQLEVQGECDTTLLVQGADGMWYYDDDGAGSLQPRLTVPASALFGPVDVWVGTFGGDSCQANFFVSAVPAAMPAPMPAPQPAPMPAPAPTPAGGCPNPALQGMTIRTNGSDLYGPDTFQTFATGGAELASCGLPGAGYAGAAPNFSMFLSGMQEYGRLEIQVTSDCDTTLLVRDAFGQWHFDDDSYGNLMPELNLTNTAALNGRVDVWVGTYGNTSCNASVEFETWLQ